MAEDTKAAAEQAASQLLKKVSKKGAKKESKKEDGTDLIQSAAHEIENLEEEVALSEVEKLMNMQGEGDFRLGGVLALIQAKGWLDGHETFKDLIVSRYGIQYRKAMYLIQIYTDLVENQIPWAKVKDLGWTKLKDLSRVLTLENLDYWVSAAQAMTVLQLQEAIKSHLKADDGETSASAPEVSDISTLSFKVHSDQKETIKQAIEKAKFEADTDFDAVALEAICLGFLGDATAVTPIHKPQITDLMKEMGFEAVLVAFEAVFPDINLDVYVGNEVETSDDESEETHEESDDE